ncbi:MAG: hypothetical protein KAJ44_01615 [Thermoplasmatales archaeon]|nr:hypothetical protein [Thermoplasmatales archaeon]
MSQLKNSEIIKHVLQILINKIGRRTSENFALVIIDTVIKELESKYDFLKYAKIENMLYSEGINANMGKTIQKLIFHGIFNASIDQNLSEKSVWA